MHAHSPDIARLVERQLRNWELTRGQKPSRVRTHEEVHQFVTISRAVGAGGARVATLTGQRLGWPVFDKELLQAMAGDDCLRQKLLATLDERDVSWLEEVLCWMFRGDFRPSSYLPRLAKTALTIARGGHAVFVGRATDLILPKAVGLRVRIIADPERCVRAFAQRGGISLDEARREVDRIERGRAEFICRRFDRQATDPLRFDMLLNLDRISPEHAVELILAGLRHPAETVRGEAARAVATG